ncbi:MAG: DASS family sodium-coupled anion symporter [Cytophagales bacterium]|nr:DASS family sodium-coupled anion symporter [Cytophagales bacterium]MDW8385047.1 DASS family sodium-coupled anion symporter [Flammeovirgaceae bacterium]
MKKIGLLVAPLIAFTILLNAHNAQLKVLAIAFLMLSWWITEAVPIGVTAMIPLVLFPLFDIISLKEATTSYADPVIYLFMGGLFIALALEKWKLHLRIALNIVKLTGTDANHIIFGFMLASYLLSMWISNTATTVMMLPIASSIIKLLENQFRNDTFKKHRFALALMLGIAYSASIGGIATLIGTPPNAVLAGYLSSTYQYSISFASWMMLCLPLSFSILFLCYVFLVKIIFPNRIGNLSQSASVFKDELQKLGSMNKGEKIVLTVFLTTALLWITGNYLNKILPFRLNDTIIAVLALIMLFAIPVDWKKGEFILSWKDSEKLSWEILLLFGGGICLASTMEKVGIVAQVGEFVKNLGINNILLVVTVLTFITVFATEVMSNVALAAVMIPLTAGIALEMKENPLITIIPITISSSLAFMLPMATPPNAIVFASGEVRVPEMVKFGLIFNLVCILVTCFWCYILMLPLFDIEIGKLPTWIAK